MKRLIGAILALALTLGIGMTALAATTSIMLDGKNYTFMSEYGTYEEDGKTFVLEGSMVRVKEQGKADRVFYLTGSADASMAEDAGNWTNNTASTSESSVETNVVSDTSSSSVAHSSDISIEKTEGDPALEYRKYELFGLIYDKATDILSYQGQRVRIFTDTHMVDFNAQYTIEHCDLLGMIDVVVRRDPSIVTYNADGSLNVDAQIMGLSVLSAEDFASRDLTPWTKPQQNMTHADSSGQALSPAEKAAFYAEYRSLGITYDQTTDRVLYQNQTVRSFLDVKQSNGESFTSGQFHGAMTLMNQDYGTIDISILRDYSWPDAEGNGMISGVQVTNVK
ncbi:hypothetical protein LJC33_07410 [Eubacteriales bacterium OttesenSCG-928-N13]|nr:hypothetical protein [Eubacteriales bacterium OttesenSCG-928-N13]